MVKLVYILIYCLALSRVFSGHEQWQLTGAQARIEQHRMADCVLNLRLANNTELPAGTRVELVQTGHHFKFGGSLAQARVLDGHLSYPIYLEHFAKVFNYATIGFYWSSHEKKRGEWELKGYAQRSLDWALSQGMFLRGHPLMWHNTLPEWIADTERGVSQLDKDIIDHVQMLVATYPQINQWDLYNETPGIRLVSPEQGARRWVEALGGPGPTSKRIVDAVRAVRPDGVFSLNHFKYDEAAYHAEIQYCLEHGVKIDAIGIQSHMHTRDTIWSEAQMLEMLDAYEGYKVPIELSEISVLSCEPFTDWSELKQWEASINEARERRISLPMRESTLEWKQYQADYIRDFYTLAFSHPSVSAIIWWSVSDYKAWRGMPAGLLDAEGNPKPSYQVIRELVEEEWSTQTSVDVDQFGRVEFKGFYGTYDAIVQIDGSRWIGQFVLLPDGERAASLSLTPVSDVSE